MGNQIYLEQKVDMKGSVKKEEEAKGSKKEEEVDEHLEEEEPSVTTDDGDDNSDSKAVRGPSEDPDKKSDRKGVVAPPADPDTQTNGKEEAASSADLDSEGTEEAAPLPTRKPGLCRVLALFLSCFVLVVLPVSFMTAKFLRRAGVEVVPDVEKFWDEELIDSIFQSGWSRLNDTFTFQGFQYFSDYIHQEEADQVRPGIRLAEKGAKAHFPIVMVPGFVTSGLELWEGEECAKKYFRQRLWGSLGSTTRTFFTDRDCWRRHLSLDPMTGLDPPNIRLRPAQGFEAADYFMTAYWVWSRLIKNLADVGYDGSTMTMMSYDWRLAFPLLEKRDGYMTKLRHSIEAMHETTGKKVVLISHSMGGLVVHFFFEWVTRDKRDGGGGCGVDWVEEHVESFINIAGPMLGVPKATPALLSGELSDTASVISPVGNMVEQFFGRRLRKDLWNTWGALWAMLPKGGDSIWGTGCDLCNYHNSTDGDCDPRCTEIHGKVAKGKIPVSPFICMTDALKMANLTDPDASKTKKDILQVLDNKGRNEESLAAKKRKYASSPGHSVDETINFLRQWGGGQGPELSASKLHEFNKLNSFKMESWHDATVTPLPYAPSLKIYCLYGVGLPTERAYYYQNRCDVDRSEAEGEEQQGVCNPEDFDPPFIINASVDDPSRDVKCGVRFADGDGSVPLLSSGYMCVDGWTRGKGSFHNPAGARVVTREYQHKQAFHLGDPMRGGPGSVEHVDILGNLHVLEDTLRIVTAFDVSNMTNHIISDIENIAICVDRHPLGGLREGKPRRRKRKAFSIGSLESENS